MTEIWKIVSGFDKYKISNKGDIYSNRGFLLKPDTGKLGYQRITLTKNSVSKKFLLHRLVALHFIPNPENKPQVNHINGIKSDNRVENLEWCTRSENEIHAHKIGLKNHKGEKHPSNKLNYNQILEIRSSYSSGLYKQKELALKYNVCFQNISRIILGKSWKQL
jgi:hypothetical protein